MRNKGFKFQKRRFGRNRQRQQTEDGEPVVGEDGQEVEKQERPKFRVFSTQLKEDALGITEYVMPPDHCIEGIIKSRYSDFHVNEIDLDGNEAILSKLVAPEMPQLPVPQFEELEAIKRKLVTIEVFTSIKNMCEKKGDHESVMIDVTAFDKESRAVLHDSLKKAFRKRIDASTLNKPEEKKVIEVKVSKPKRKGDRLDWDWPQQYVHFLMYKENIDTVQAIGALAQSVRTRPGNFNYAGTKDKRAKTTQWVSVRTMEPERLVRATKRLHLIYLGNFKFSEKPLKLGMLKGNRFRIALRQVTTPELKAKEIIEVRLVNPKFSLFNFDFFSRNSKNKVS